MERHKVEYSQLEVGYRFPAGSYQLDEATVATYLEAVGDTSSLYLGTGLVPPMAVAAHSMAALSDSISLPPGAIHVSQELEFLELVTTKDALTSHARVSRKQSRGKFHLLTVEISVFNQRQTAVLSGRMSFILPGEDEA